MGCGGSTAATQPPAGPEDKKAAELPASKPTSPDVTNAADSERDRRAEDSNNVTTDVEINHVNESSQEGKPSDISEQNSDTNGQQPGESTSASPGEAAANGKTGSQDGTKDNGDHVMSQNNGDHVDNNGGAASVQSPQQPNDDNSQGTEEAKGEDDMAAAQEPSRLQAKEQFTAALRLSGSLMTPESILSFAGPDVEQLTLTRALPPTCQLNTLLAKLPNLKEVDLSNNNLGPHGFRALMLSLCHNSTIVALNVSGNMADTDSSESIGKMPQSNKCLSSLDVSHNNLGKEYFSRCVGSVLANNTALVTLRCESIGSTDLTALAAGLSENSSLGELWVSHNQLTDSAAFTEKLVTALKRPECGLQSLQMKNCSLKDADVLALASTLRVNTSLRKLTLNGAQVDGSASLLELLVACVGHPVLHTVEADDVLAGTPSPWNPDASHKPTSHCAIETLSLSNTGLTDAVLKSLVEFLGTAAMPELRSVVLTNNPEITMEGLNAVLRLATSTECQLEQLSWGLNSADGLPSVLASGHLPHLRYLNLRKAKTSPAVVSQLANSLGPGGVDTLVLDGIKLAGSQALQEMLATGPSSSLSALSLGGCSLADRDLGLLTDALKQGLPLRMLKLSGNRISGKGIPRLVEALLAQPAPPLKLIDLANNQIDTAGAKQLATLFTTSSHKSSIHSLNLNGNAIGSAGLIGLVSLLNKSPLISLHLSRQSVTYEEEDLEEITEALAIALGFKYDRQGDEIKSASCALTNPPIGLNVKLMQLGGNPGELGKHLDSTAITTDFSQNRLPYFPLEQALQLAAAFKGCDLADGRCLFSREDWNYIISADKDAPSWLQIPEELSKALYLSHLPASISVPKLEGIMENDVDTNVREVYLLKDAISQKNNGLAWALMADEAGVAAARAYVHTGEARVFGQSFLMSGVNVVIDDDGDSAATERARRDMAQRAATLQAEQASHRRLIQQSYQESQERHAYRLANPAYADGRIW